MPDYGYGYTYPDPVYVPASSPPRPESAPPPPQVPDFYQRQRPVEGSGFGTYAVAGGLLALTGALVYVAWSNGRDYEKVRDEVRSMDERLTARMQGLAMEHQSRAMPMPMPPMVPQASPAAPPAAMYSMATPMMYPQAYPQQAAFQPGMMPTPMMYPQAAVPMSAPPAAAPAASKRAVDAVDRAVNNELKRRKPAH